MAKPQRKKQTRPSWFQKQVEKGGQDFLLRKPPLEIQRDAINIIRDIARGNIMPKDYQYLFDMKVLANVRISIYEKYIELHTYGATLTFATQVPNGTQILERSYGVAPENFQKIFNNTNNQLTAYGAILQSIDAFIGFVNNGYSKSEENYEQIYTSAYHQLSRFKFII